MTNPISSHIFENRDGLAVTLAGDISAKLTDAISKKGSAVLAVSGGSTPKLLFQKLSQTQIEWDKVTIVLVDERYVAPDDDRSNERLVRDNLLSGPAANGDVMGFWIDGKSAIQAKELLNTQIANLGAFDVIILGMGLDGHTASFFPGGNNLQAATNSSCKSAIMDMEADGAGETRLTITLPVICMANDVILHIEGDGKKQVFDKAMADDTSEILPIRTVIEALPKPISLYWAP